MIWDNHNISFAVGSIEAVQIKSIRQLRHYKNGFHLELSEIQSRPGTNLILIVQKSTSYILGYFNFKVDLFSKSLISGINFDTFPIEKLELSTLEVYRFQFADQAWMIPDFSRDLISAFDFFMMEVGCQIVLCHILTPEISGHSISEQMKSIASMPPFIYCELINNDSSYKGDICFNSAIDQKNNNSPISVLGIQKLIATGFEVWSPIKKINDMRFSIQLFGYISSEAQQYARPFTLLSHRANSKNKNSSSHEESH